MDIFLVLFIVVAVIILLGMMLDKINWTNGIKLLLVIAVFGVLMYFLVSRFI